MRLHLIDQPLSFLLYNPFAVVVTLAHAWAAFAILPIYVSLEKIDRSLLEAASRSGRRRAAPLPAHHPAAVHARRDRRRHPDLRAHHRRLCHARTGGRHRKAP